MKISELSRLTGVSTRSIRHYNNNGLLDAVRMDTPEKVRKAAKWLTGRGASLITGGVQVPPSRIGKPDSSTYYSGPEEVFEAYRKDLEVLTGTDYRGEDPGQGIIRCSYISRRPFLTGWPLNLPLHELRAN
ncbi:MerR family DNA-binding transcriptional regulator [Paenibacillus chitinolyticus]|uniref:MerR family DNA-binding transcriptional regulator n=1 Tax=Paenibacillus chitinolyticus TaxID=79263 RepID=UPI0036274BB6